jgi:hypothetical protein
VLTTGVLARLGPFRHSRGQNSEPPTGGRNTRTPAVAEDLEVELGGLEPLTSWVRSNEAAMRFCARTCRLAGPLPSSASAASAADVGGSPRIPSGFRHSCRRVPERTSQARHPGRPGRPQPLPRAGARRPAARTPATRPLQASLAAPSAPLAYTREAELALGQNAQEQLSRRPGCSGGGRENDGLRWPRRGGLKWPHVASVVVRG